MDQEEEIDVGGFSQDERKRAEADTERSSSDDEDQDDDRDKPPNLRHQQDQAPPLEENSVSDPISTAANPPAENISDQGEMENQDQDNAQEAKGGPDGKAVTSASK